MLIKDAGTIWNTLRGVVCVYKPPEVSVKRCRKNLIDKLCADLNQMEVREPTQFVAIEGDPLKKLSVQVRPNYADHPLVVGPRYQEQDFHVSWSNFLGYYTSGVLIFGIRSGTKWAKYLRENRPMRVYKVQGVLGQTTDNCYKTGKVVFRSSWKHVNQMSMDKLLSHMQGAHQKKMFEMCGVDIQSQTAYDLAVQGLIRPVNSKLPIIYGIKCVEFDKPNFTLEIQCINEYETYMTHLINEIGLKLHSSAHCTGIKCIRHSYFKLEHALLPKHYDLQNVLTNMEMCNKILEENEHLLNQDSMVLRQ